jgi:hypothetical protein
VVVSVGSVVVSAGVVVASVIVTVVVSSVVGSSVFEDRLGQPASPAVAATPTVRRKCRREGRGIVEACGSAGKGLLPPQKALTRSHVSGSMHRRTLLAGLAGAIGGATAAQSLASPGLVPQGLRDFEVRTGEDVRYDPPSNQPVLATVGDRRDVLVSEARGPHDVVVTNDADSARRLVIAVNAAGDLVFRHEPRLDAGAAVLVGLLEPAGYTVRAGLSGHTEEVPVPADRFDCNSWSTSIVVTPGGRVKSRSSGTLVGCSPISSL